mmetsp:Transcript_55043/g.154843  ORF Transcript_55043/g.154843 Transcript_55043/m.154843 type:complete len:300 (+) Transcript_55043:87-986(+)
MWRWCLALTLGLSSILEASCVQLRSNETDPIDKWLDMHKPKIFFAAGFEGSGIVIFQRLWKSSFVWNDDSKQHVLKFPQDWICGVHWAFHGYDVMKSRVATIKVNDVYALPFQATYPSCGVRTDDHEHRLKHYHPDLLWIQQASADSEVSDRIIFINRPLVDCLKLTCMVRHYETCDNQVKTLSNNAKILKQQLLDIDRSTASCYDYPSDAAVSAEVAKVFGNGLPSMNYWFEERNISHIDSILGVSAADLKGLADLTKQLNDICHKMHKFTMEHYKTMIDRGHGDIRLLRTAEPTILY